jgi:aspartyl-tRNA(Asn)/glutamyl-tRNA(Gln) amidotransferase subunit C
MSITREEVLRLAELSSLSFSDAELDSFKTDLENIVGYISQLDELNVDGVEPTYQVFEMDNVWRADEITEQETGREALLGLASETVEHQIKVPKVL